MAPKRNNTNAQKHALYARHYSAQERADLGRASPSEPEPEIHMLRAIIDRLLTLIENCDDEDRRIKLYNSLFVATQRLSNAMRTQAYIVGDKKELLTSFWEAVERFRKAHEV